MRSEHFEEQCAGVVTKGRYDDGWFYRIEVTSGDRLDTHRDEEGELWVCDFEVHPIRKDTQHLEDPRGGEPTYRCANERSSQ